MNLSKVHVAKLSITPGAMIKGHLRSRGLRQEDMAKELGVSRVTVNQWINDVFYPSTLNQYNIEIFSRGAIPRSVWPLRYHRDQRRARVLAHSGNGRS